MAHADVSGEVFTASRPAAEMIALKPFLIRLAVLAMVSIAGLVGLLATTVGGVAQTAAFVRPGDMTAGALLFKGTEPGQYVEAPRVQADYDVTVSGPTIRTRVTQSFRNPTDGWVEGVYVYPLPEKGAVDTMKLVIGDRVIVADVKERKQAKAIYERAKADGKTAALVEQERPNLFSNSVANIGPGETVVVQIEYQAPAQQDAERMSFRIPLVVAPRYNPAPIVQTVEMAADGGGWGVTADPVADRDRISPPVNDPRTAPPTNPVTITVRLDAGFRLGEVASLNHKVDVATTSDTARIVTLTDGATAADRDFVLSWTPAAGPTPSVGLFREHVGGADYLLAYVTPPAAEQQIERRPREAVFVIDNSGSMSGPSMAQAKASLIFALDRLSPADRFEVIRFDDTMERLFLDTVPATPENVARAKGFVAGLDARGGTEMLAPMKAALSDPRPNDADTVRQVVFLTDGAIGDEQRLFEAIGSSRGRSRLFMVGIGSAPNSYLMTRAAELGRGTFTHIGSAGEVDGRMRELFAKLESPVVTGLSATFSEGVADMTPRILPDLYRGEPLAVAAKVERLSGVLKVGGMIGSQPWTATLDVTKAAEGAGISKLWARRKIDDAEVAKTLREMTPDAADAAILKLALEHRLTTRLTSLVAVDQTPRRPAGAKLTRADVPLNLPAGWDFEKVFGTDRPAGGAPNGMRKADGDDAAPQLERIAFKGVATAAAPVAAPGAAQQAGVPLPQTATDAELRLMAGIALLLLAVGLLIVRPARRRTAA